MDPMRASNVSHYTTSDWFDEKDSLNVNSVGILEIDSDGDDPVTPLGVVWRAVGGGRSLNH